MHYETEFDKNNRILNEAKLEVMTKAFEDSQCELKSVKFTLSQLSRAYEKKVKANEAFKALHEMMKLSGDDPDDYADDMFNATTGVASDTKQQTETI